MNLIKNLDGGEGPVVAAWDDDAQVAGVRVRLDPAASQIWTG